MAEAVPEISEFAMLAGTPEVTISAKAVSIAWRAASKSTQTLPLPAARERRTGAVGMHMMQHLGVKRGRH
jgi:hypothetical protein